jgi:hypothetical protein
MNCANHPETVAVAYCRTCGKPLCQVCERQALGSVYCQEHEPPAATANPYTAPPPSPYTAPPYAGPAVPNAPSPGLAFVLGMIPGVGAIYNGQYAKGLIHVILLGLLISIMNTGAAHDLEPMFGMLIGLLFFYMAFEAYHTAAKRQRGEEVDEFSSLFPMGRPGRGFPVGPLLLILLGVVFLLDTLEIVRLYQVVRYWPVFLILLGGYMLYIRVRGDEPPSSHIPEYSNER